MNLSNESAGTMPLLWAAVLLTGACDGGGSSGADRGFGIPYPEAVLATRAIEPEALEPAVMLDGRVLEPVREGERWTVSAMVPEGELVSVEIVWTELIGDVALPIASISRDIGPLGADTRVEIDPGDYDSARFDSDGDDVSNLDERERGTDPFNGNDPGGPDGESDGGTDPSDGDEPNRPNDDPGTTGDGSGDDDSMSSGGTTERAEVFIYPFDASGGTPVIDGSFEGIWQQATFADRLGNNLMIDRLLIEEDGAEAATGEVPYTWFAMHDFESLYLFVQFERGVPTPHRDSERFFDDDAVNLFFDGDASRGERLEGVDGGDDRYIVIPLLRRGGGGPPGAFAPRAQLAPEVPPSLEYGVCVCEGSATGWELKIALRDLNIEVGRPFGFEVQLDQDVDGGERDARWGWANPPQGERDESFRFESPAFSGTVTLRDRRP